MKKELLLSPILCLFTCMQTVKADDFALADTKDIALCPTQDQCRNFLSLDGIWQFEMDSQEEGEQQLWQNGLKAAQPIAVPGR